MGMRKLLFVWFLVGQPVCLGRQTLIEVVWEGLESIQRQGRFSCGRQDTWPTWHGRSECQSRGLRPDNGCGCVCLSEPTFWLFLKGQPKGNTLFLWVPQGKTHPNGCVFFKVGPPKMVIFLLASRPPNGFDSFGLPPHKQGNPHKFYGNCLLDVALPMFFGATSGSSQVQVCVLSSILLRPTRFANTSNVPKTGYKHTYKLIMYLYIYTYIYIFPRKKR